MARPREDDRDAVNRAFAELVAGYHLTSDRPDPLSPDSAGQTEPLIDEAADATTVPTSDAAPGDPPEAGRTIEHLLFRPESGGSGRAGMPSRDAGGAAEASQRYEPEPLPPLPRPGLSALIGWIGIGYAAVLVLALAFGLHVPPWAAWLAIGGFLGGFAVLLTRLPRHRPPDAGDGAVL